MKKKYFLAVIMLTYCQDAVSIFPSIRFKRKKITKNMTKVMNHIIKFDMVCVQIGTNERDRESERELVYFSGL